MTTPQQAAQDSSPQTAAQRRDSWLVMVGVGSGVLMATLDSSIVNIALPTLVEQLHTDFATVQWVVLSYILVLTSLMLGAARLGDIHGKKKLYVIGLVIFTAASLLCALSPGVGWLIAVRAIQGLGAAMTQSLGIAIVTENFPPAQRGRALGIMGSIVSTGIALGPPLGGILIDLAGWRSIFMVNVPIGVIAISLVLRFVPEGSSNRQQTFDLAGALVLFLSLGAYAFGMTQGEIVGFAQPFTLTLLGGALLGLVIFILIEKRTRQPMVDLRLFANPLFSANLAMSLLVFAVLATGLLLPFYLELAQGYPTREVGLLLMVNPVVMIVASPLAGSLSDRFGPRGISLVGLFILLGGCLAMSTLALNTGVGGYLLRAIPLALGMSMFQSPNNSAVMGVVPRQQLGIAGGLLSLSRTLGSSTGLPLMTALFAAQAAAFAGLSSGVQITAMPADALVVALSFTYHVATAIVLVNIVIAFFALFRRKPAV